MNRLTAIRKASGAECDPRFWNGSHGTTKMPAILKLVENQRERAYCKPCLMERISNDREFATDLLLFLTLKAL